MLTALSLLVPATALAAGAASADPAPAAPETVVTLQNAATGECVDVPGGTSSPVRVQQWACQDGNRNQQFSVVPGPDGSDSYRSVASGLCLDVAGESTNDGAPLIQWTCHGHANQRFVPAPASDGVVGLVSASSGKCVDVPAEALTDDGTGLQQWQCYANESQGFRIGAVAATPPAPVPTSPAPTSPAPTPSGSAAGSTWPDSGDVTVDWSHPVRAIDDLAYGVNCPACIDPAYTSRPAFVQSLKTLTQGKGLIRLHGWGMIDPRSGQYWLNPDSSWNADKIKTTLGPLIAAGLGPQLLIDIPSGPQGDRNMPDADSFAAFGAALVKIVNSDDQFGVKYWEFPNEQESTLDTDQMAAVMSKTSTAMKAVDPGVLVGGPATSWVNPDYVSSVVQKAHGAVDFVSVHTYGGDGTQSDEASFASARGAASGVASLRTALDGVSPGRHIPIYLDEYNVGWNTAPSEFDHRGAVYYALLQAGVLAAGGDATAHWSGMAPDHDMTLVDHDLRLLPPANLFTALNQYGRGQQVATSVADPASTLAFAAAAADGSTHALLLANPTSSARTVKLSFHGWAPASLNVRGIDESGFSGPLSTSAQTVADQGVTLAPESVVLLTSG